MLQLAMALRFLRKAHTIHKAKHKHVVFGHFAELAGGMFSLLKMELLAGSFALAGAAILLAGLFMANDE